MLTGVLDEEYVKRMADPRAVDPAAYHIMHEGNLAELLSRGFLYCDSYVRQQNISHIAIGYKHTKRDRLETTIPIASDINTGDCVPFYFCPRSAMLYVIYRNDSEDLASHYGEDPVVHLRFNVRKVWDWALSQNLRVFITNGNAASPHTEVFNDLSALKILNWDAISTKYWQDVSTEKAAELLVENRVPFGLVEEIGVKNNSHQAFVNGILSKCPQYSAVSVNVHPDWYYGK